MDSSGVAPESPVCRTGVFLLDHEPVSAEAVGLEPTKVLPSPVFKTGSSSGRMTSVKLRGLESNQRPPGSEPGVATSSNHPAVFSALKDSSIAKRFGEEESNLRRLVQRRAAYHWPIPENALWELNPPFQLGRLAPLPLGQGHVFSSMRKGRESNPQGSSLDRFRTGGHRQLACPSI